MPPINDLLNDATISVTDKISFLKEKGIDVPTWAGKKNLEGEFNPKFHPVMDKSQYPDVVTNEGVEKVTRVALDLQRLAVKRMTELCVGIPVKRIYKPANEKQKEVARYLEAILVRNRIDSLNIERLNMLFAGCEVLTLWYATEETNKVYGFDSPLKFRCRNFSPMLGDELYPLFDEYGDLVALSVGYTRKVGKKKIAYFDTYTDSLHIQYSDGGDGKWAETVREKTTLGKIPAVYMWRPSPIWENTSETIYEIEMALSRNGNYLRKNSKPLFVVMADEVISYGDEKSQNREFRSVMQYPTGARAEYVTWSQAVDNLKFFVDNLRSLFFTQLQLPDWSYEKMSQQALSGESRKQLFIDAQMKVTDESGRLIEFFDREINVLKAFLKSVLTAPGYTEAIDALIVETKITPFSIGDQQEQVNMLITANGGLPIMSQREAIEALGHSEDVDKTMQEIAEQSQGDVFNPLQGATGGEEE